MAQPLQPVLVMPVYRGGKKFARALASVRSAEPYFRRIILSLNSAVGSPDADVVADYQAQGRTKLEVIRTNSEISWMEHQYFWLAHLEQSGETGTDWIMWFAHDDQIRPRGIIGILDAEGNWPIDARTIYLGPWGMRYDPIGEMYDGPADAPLESWTSFPLAGPLRLPVAEWIAQQLEQPTYINMSGCVTQLGSFQALRNFPIQKPGGMRIEMATAAAPLNKFVAEFNEPIVITHTSKASDRTTYARVARRDDAHMAVWFVNYLARHPRGIGSALRATRRVTRQHFDRIRGTSEGVSEDWRHRCTVEP